MRTKSNRLVPLVGAGVLFAAHAQASPHAGVDAQLYKPALDGGGLSSIESARVMKKDDFSFRLEFNYGNEPLTLPVPGIGDTAEDSVLEYTAGMHFTLGFAVTEKLTVGADAGLFRTSTDAGYGDRGRFDTNVAGGIRVPSTGLISLRPLSNIDQAGGPDGRSGPIDPRIGVKYQAMKGRSYALAGQLNISVPFGDEEMFLGDRSFVVEPRVALDWYPLPRAKMVFNGGARFRKRTVLEATESTPDAAQAVLDIGSEALLGAGLLYNLLPELTVTAETQFFLPLPASMSWGSCELFNGDDCDTVDDAYMDAQGNMQDSRYYEGADYGDLAGYVLGGFLYRLSGDVTLAMSAGAGLTGARADGFRIISGLRWSPTPEGEIKLGLGDRDRDGIPDATDACPEEPEDKDGYSDDDGCPDFDNDQDGINDPEDACPDEPEDRDGYQDSDGCPERDNDGDGVPDVTDRCPFKKEDLDNYEDGDGCPDNDNDGDGIPDDIDQCPIEPETVNGLDDMDGCPDEMQRTGPVYNREQGIIDLQGKRIDFRGRTSKLDNDATDTLNEVAGEILANDLEVRITVYVALGTRSTNANVVKRTQAQDLRLSQERANAVLQYLRSRGVPDTLVNQVEALGSTRPLNTFTKYDANQNRVEFNVVRQVTQP